MHYYTYSHFRGYRLNFDEKQLGFIAVPNDFQIFALGLIAVQNEIQILELGLITVLNNFQIFRAWPYCGAK